ncbi:Hypothetical protein, putative [Bodo saltans]|uniref:Uncharacterized protein n=1 Tax=Bodo saltans TaxID=75058 RepID=A0A0S4ISA2_BODSA|nr:Hypothetical protein, putative [Bodo saltans]|eukprot:CUF48747.1 Hypothetical protein, putative [Bodo saltans]
MDINEVLDRLDEDAPVVEEQDEDLLRAYGLHKSEDVKAVRGDKTARGDKMAHYMHMIHVHPDVAESYFRLGQLMRRDEIVRLRSRDTVDRRDVWAMGIKYEPTNARAYYHLARDLAHIKSEDHIAFPDGRSMTPTELCIEAIRHKLDFAECYYYLSTLLPDATSTVTLYNGRIANRRELQLDAVALDKTIFYAYSSIAFGMEIDDVIEFAGNTLMKNDFYALAIHYGPHDARAYINLAANLKKGESFKLLDGKKLSRKELYTAAIERDEESIQAVYNLAIELGSGEEITLKDGTVTTKRALLCKVLDMDPYYKKAYGALAYDMKKKEVIMLRDPDEDFDDEPTAKTKRMLYALAGIDFSVPVGLNDDEDHLLALQTIEVTQEELEKVRRKEAKKRRIAELRRMMDDQNKAESKGKKLPRRRREGSKKKKKEKKVEEDVPVGAVLAPGTRLRLSRFFRAHAPEKLDDIDKLLPLFAGREESRFQLLINIYGPEPSTMDFVAEFDDITINADGGATTPAAGGNTSISVSSSSGGTRGGGGRSYSPPDVPSPTSAQGGRRGRLPPAARLKEEGLSPSNLANFDRGEMEEESPSYFTGGKFDRGESNYEMLNFNTDNDDQRPSYF